MVWQYFTAFQRDGGGGGHLFVSLSGNYLPLGLLLEGEGGGDLCLQILKSMVAEVYRIVRPEAYESVCVLRVFKQCLLRHHSVTL